MSETEASTMATVVGSMWKSFRQVPQAAVPAMLDCVLSSTGLSPSLLLSSLLDSFASFIQGAEGFDSEQQNYIRSSTAALCHLLKKSGADLGALQSFIWKILIPLMRLVDTHDYEILNETADSFFDVVIETNMWDVVEGTMVPFFLRSIGLSMGMLQSEELAIYSWNSCLVFRGTGYLFTDSDVNQNSLPFPLHISCHILTLMLNFSVQSQTAIKNASKSDLADSCCAEKFAKNLMWDLCNLIVQMLLQSMEHRSCAIKFLLPHIFQIFVTQCAFEISVRGQMYVLSRGLCFKKIWTCCRTLFCLGPLERRDSYSVLSLYLSFFSCSDGHENGYHHDGEEEFDIRSEKEFWDEIKKGLVHEECLVRKQSLHILKTVLHINEASICYSGVSETTSSRKSSAPHNLTKRGRWADKEAKSMGVGKICNSNDPSLKGHQKWVAFFLLYEMLEEYGTHLVEAAWNHQITLLFHSSFPQNESLICVSGELNQNLMEQSSNVFSWLAVLWERGFLHDNPRVRCLIMDSFLGIEWKRYKNCAQLVPEDFVIGPFLQALNDPVHHKDFGTKGIYTSRTIDGATKFMCEYSSCLNLRKRIELLTKLASSARRQPFGRAGLMGLAECIASAANGVQVHSNNEVGWHKDTPFDMVQVQSAMSSHDDKPHLLNVLRFIIESSKQHFNPHYRLRVCDKILDAVASAMHASDVSLEVLLQFISAVPREFTDCGGPLRAKVQDWFSSSDDKYYASNCCDTANQLLKSVYDFPGSFLGLHQSVSAFVNYDDEDLDAWESEARRWARVVFLLIKDNQCMDPILMFIHTQGIDVSKKNYHLGSVPVKFFILVSSLIQELQIMQERVIDTGKRGRTKIEPSLLEMVAHESSTEVSIIMGKFAKLLLSILEGLVSFASLSCSIFWSNMVEDTDLPCSVRGKLGGPSQRRLSSSCTTAVLQAIISMKVISSISLWCVQFETDNLLNHAFIFLWEFFWKIVSSPTCDSEIIAEIRLAAYEALVHVLKAVVSAFSSVALHLIMENQKPSLVNKGKSLLDLLVLSFLQNINNLIVVETLVRTRRAILMNWKWICLEYLLSIPNHALDNGVCIENVDLFFSDVTLHLVFDDLVDSLENAGEGAVLPMLRSIRLLLELFNTMRCARVPRDVVDIQMIWHLVHSSWMLHVSCNKRRVAPIAALLSSILHHSVFSMACMHESDNAPGPLKWFIQKLIEEGTKSPRTIRLAALHLAGLWLLNPKIIKYYMKELKMLTLYGSVAFDEDFEAELSENDDARREVSLLAKSPDSELTEAFINTELYARVSVAVLFYKLANLAAVAGSTNENENCHAALDSGKMFLLQLLDLVVNDKDLAKELYKKYSAVHRRKIRAWQMICILSQFVDQDILEEVTSNLQIALCRNNLPAVRQYLETFAINLYLRFPFLIRKQLVPIFRDYDMRPQALSSYVFIAANIILHAPATVQSSYLEELLPPIIPLLTSHHHSLRGFAQLLVYHVLWKLLPSLGSSAYEIMPLETRCFEDLKLYLAKNPDCARLRASMEGYLDAYDPKYSITPAGIFSNRVEELEFECVPISLMEQVTTFLNDVREDLRCSMAKDAVTIKNDSFRINENLKCMEISSNVDDDKSEAMLPKDVLLLDFQKKITISKHDRQERVSDIDLDKNAGYKPLMEMEKEDQLVDELLRSRSIAMKKMKGNRQQLILVASLLDRIPNLAGLARTCEVFKAAGLAISDANVVNDKQFQLISVTAEKWVPIIEVPESNLKVFLQKKKQEGFSILGLEQTANSISLDQYIFPKKTVLVLGREKEGIPAEIIHILDACIEIPQLGVVRSLNVHVSGAIALWEYTRQQRSS
ncbi:tRNA (guanosine(18)-2'-O)-methyltransferase [Bertholletia excelsa]